MRNPKGVEFVVSAATSHGEYAFGAAVVVLYGFVECVARDSEPSEAQDSAVVEDLVTDVAASEGIQQSRHRTWGWGFCDWRDLAKVERSFDFCVFGWSALLEAVGRARLTPLTI